MCVYVCVSVCVYVFIQSRVDVQKLMFGRGNGERWCCPIMKDVTEGEEAG